MKINIKIIALTLLVSTLISCNTTEKADGYGNFEATEITISAENNGKLLQFELAEGAILKKGAFVGYIDTIPLALKKDQLQISKEIVYSKSKGVLSQINVLKAALKTATISKNRIENLLKKTPVHNNN